MSLKTLVRPKAQKKLLPKGPHLDLIIVGGGPAGLSAAIYALRAGLNIVLIEKMILGGMAGATFMIDNYPGFPEGVSGQELANRLQEQVKRLGLEIVWSSALAIKKEQETFEVALDNKILTSKAIIIASGTESAKMGIPGEDEFRGKGVSYCATCDGPFYKDKNIIVVGGGNSAIEEALFLTRYASKISVVHRRDELRADKILAEKAKAHPKIYFFWRTVIEAIKGEQKVSEVILKDLKTNRNINVPIEGIFIYIGSQPNSSLVKDLVKLDKSGYIMTDNEMRTSTKGLFAAGDIRVKSLRQIVTACADGATAAEAARKFIESQTPHAG